MRNSTNKFIKEAKLAYYSNLGNKLSDHPETGQKPFWSANKKVVNKKDRNLYGYTVIIYQQRWLEQNGMAIAAEIEFLFVPLALSHSKELVRRLFSCWLESPVACMV